MNFDKRIFIGAPISNRSWIAPYYLRNLYAQTYPKHLCEILWIVNNSNDKTMQLLTDFKQKHEHEYKRIRIQIYNASGVPEDKRTADLREKFTYSWLAELRNRLLDEFLKTDCDYYLNCDSDILMRKDCLERLVSHDKDFVAGLIYNGYLFADGTPYKYPNILREYEPRQYKHVVNYRVKNPETNYENPLMEVDFTGAINIVSRDVAKKARYAWHKQGEDEPFSYSARKAGFSIWCDLYNYNQHVMAKELLEQFKNFGVE